MNDPLLAEALAVLDTADVAASDDAGCTDLLGAIRKVRGWVGRVAVIDQAPSFGGALAEGVMRSREPVRHDQLRQPRVSEHQHHPADGRRP